MFKSVSFWVFVALAATILLQLYAVPGVFLMILGGALLAGFLVHVFLVALAIEALFGRIPRLFGAIPILAYGAYYGMCALEAHQIAALATKMNQENADLALKFDPMTQALVVRDAQGFVADHKILVAYEPSQGYSHTEYTSYRRLQGDQCKRADEARQDLPTISERADVEVNYHSRGQNPFSGAWRPTYGDADLDLCMLSLPEMPKHDILAVVQRDVMSSAQNSYADRSTSEASFKEISIDFSSNGKILASYHNALIKRLPLFPQMYIGCGLDSGTPAWRCGAGLIRQRETAILPDPIGVVLGIPKLIGAELASAPPVPDFDRVIDEIESYRRPAGGAKL
jgi:hypothetical protein